MDLSWSASSRCTAQDGNLDELRYWLVKHWALQPLLVKPGTTFAYANINYVIAGAMIERARGGKHGAVTIFGFSPGDTGVVPRPTRKVTGKFVQNKA
jgi:hypothetical protein